jgi:hypothetical protein
MDDVRAQEESPVPGVLLGVTVGLPGSGKSTLCNDLLSWSSAGPTAAAAACAADHVTDERGLHVWCLDIDKLFRKLRKQQQEHQPCAQRTNYERGEHVQNVEVCESAAEQAGGEGQDGIHSTWTASDIALWKETRAQALASVKVLVGLLVDLVRSRRDARLASKEPTRTTSTASLTGHGKLNTQAPDIAVSNMLEWMALHCDVWRWTSPPQHTPDKVQEHHRPPGRGPSFEQAQVDARRWLGDVDHFVVLDDNMYYRSMRRAAAEVASSEGVGFLQLWMSAPAHEAR